MDDLKNFWCVCVFALLFGAAAKAQSSEPLRMGLTLKPFEQMQKNNPAVCSTPRPLLCIIDINAPAPSYLSNTKNWTGGLVAATDAVSGNRFSNIDEANAYCAQNFGQDWRVASFHDGGGWALRAYGSAGKMGDRVWVDIKTQSSGTCWSR